MLLNRKAVRDDLKLSEEQTRSVREALVKQMTVFLDTADLPPEQRSQRRNELRKQSDALAAQILRPEQSVRLKQITLQLEGPRAFACPAIAKDLGITEEQQQRMKAIHAEARKEFARLFTEGQSKPEAGKAAKELHQRVREQVMNVLTDAQKAHWKEMTGAPIQGDVSFGAFGAGRHGHYPS
jgi:Spy/CpxP family protein refolding chaperone